MLKRIHLDPGLPVANPSIATWQNPPHRLSEIRSKTLPTEADIVLVGSGITACSIARTLLSSTSSLSKKPRIVVLEARTLCSGASGRNGGHLRDSPFMYFGYLKEKFGHESAKKMAAFRGSHIAEIFQVAKEEGIFDIAEIEETEAVDVVFQEEKWKETKEEVDDYKRTEKATYPEVLEEDTAKIVGFSPDKQGRNYSNPYIRDFVFPKRLER